MDHWAGVGANIGAMLGGGSDQAYQQGELRGAQVARALAGAREARDKEVGRQQAAQRAYSAGNNDLGDALMRGENLQETTAGLGNIQHQGFLTDAMKQATDPNASLDSLNRRMIVIGGKPVDLTNIQDNTVYNPMVSPGSQNLQTNEIGNAMIGAEHALSTQRNASAGALDAMAGYHHAQTDKVLGMPMGALDDATLQSIMAQGSAMANEGGPGANQAAADLWIQQQMEGHGAHTVGGAPHANDKPTSLSSEEIKAMFGTNEPGVVNTSEYRRFLDFQRSHGIPNAQRAAQMFRTDMSNVEGGPELPAAPAPAVDSPSLVDSFKSAVGFGPKHTGPVDHAAQKSAADAATPTSQAEFDALPPGTLFVNPKDGKLLRKKS